MRARTQLLVLAAVFSVSAGAQQAPVETGLIGGQVVDAVSGRPISAAVVSLGGAATAPPRAPQFQPPALRPRILTGSDGRFVFRDLPRGTFTVTATKPGYTPGALGRRRVDGPPQQLTLADGERVGDATIRLWKFGAISGMVVDEAGEPQVGVAIGAFRQSITTGTPRFVPRAGGRTDDRGMYRIGSLTPGEYLVVVPTRQVSVPVSLLSTSDFRSRAQIPEIGVIATFPGRTLQLGDSAYGLPPGVAVPPPPSGHRLLAYPTTFYPGTPAASQAAAVSVASGEEKNSVDIQLRPVPMVRVSGVVTGMDAPQSLMLRLLPSESRGFPVDEDSIVAVPNTNGAFAFPAVASGQYVLRTATRPRPPSGGVEASPVMWGEVPMTVGDADIEGLQLALRPGLRVTGRIEFDGVAPRPAAASLDRIRIAVEQAEGDFGVVIPTPAARLDSSGQFVSIGLPPGRYYVRVLDSPQGWMFRGAMHDGTNVADVPLELRSGDATVVLAFTDRWTSLRGAVLPQGAKRPEDAIVLLFPTDAQLWTYYGGSVRRIKSARATRTGEYSFRSVPTGDYYVIAIPDEAAGDWQDVRFLESLTRVATRVSIADGDHRVQNLPLREVRR